jgi:hypothetical protein
LFFCFYSIDRKLLICKEILYSPAQIRTGVKGSKGLYAWPLQSAEKIIPPPGFRA